MNHVGFKDLSNSLRNSEKTNAGEQFFAAILGGLHSAFREVGAFKRTGPGPVGFQGPFQL